MRLFLLSDWTFGTLELVSLLSAIATFLAVLTSLFLALKSKTVKYKVIVNHKMNGLRIINTGDAKFFISNFGVLVGNDYYLNRYERICKFLSKSIKVLNSTTFYDMSLGKALLEPGDVIEVGLSAFDKKLFECQRVFLFIEINSKLKKFRLNTEKVEYHGEVDMKQYKKISKNEIKNIGFYLAQN